MLKISGPIIAESMAIAVVGALSATVFVHYGAADSLHRFALASGYRGLEGLSGAVLAVALCLSMILWRWNARLRVAVTALRQSEAAVYRAARRDSLTGIPNLLGLYDVLADAGAVEDGASSYLLLIDINRFKSINDLRGHAAGDAILLQVAQRLEKACGPKDSAFRIGGDEFAIIRSGKGEDVPPLCFAASLLEELARPCVIRDWSETLSCSIGISAIEAGDDASEVVHRADQALHHAKSGGPESFAVFDEALGNALRGKALLEAELREAVVADALVPFFQPILKIETGELIGFEVLARWRRDVSGYVPPDVFIPMAEALGLIDRLSDQLLRKCCLAMKTWAPDLMLSFNLSPRQLNHANLAERIKQILDDHQISGRRLAIEITETAVFIDMDRARTVISQLRMQGIRVSLDDFGIGTSSLAVLSQLPFDTIKIDRSFISNISENPQNAKIVRGVLALARSLELTVTAEGIESGQDLDFLKENNCILGQGYFFSRPVPEDALPQLMEDVARAVALAREEVTELTPTVVGAIAARKGRNRRAAS